MTNRLNSPIQTKLIYRTLFVLILFFSYFFSFPQKASADFFDCEVNVSPSSVTRVTSQAFTFTTTGSSYTGGGAMWVKITRPSGDFIITNGSASGWSASTNSSDVIFTSPIQVDPGTVSFTVTALSGSNDVSSTNWTVEMSDAGNGSSAKACHGNLGTAIAGTSGISPSPTPTPTPVPDSKAPSISNVSISGVNDTSVTISWTTNESANSHINYGTSTSYGSSKSDSGMNTSHSLTLNGLSVNTTYHGQIQSADSLGNTAISSDFTFATSQNAAVTVTTVTTVITPTPSPTPIPDRSSPRITMVTDFQKVFTAVPLIEGDVTDNVAVHSIEYSFDDGKNWSSVEIGDTGGQKKLHFSFTPLLPGEGNYQLKIRAKDTSDNEAISQAQQLILDRLPPLVGGNFLSIGPQVLQTDSDGNYTTVVGLNAKLTLSAIGGATAIELRVNSQPQRMLQNVQTRLWSSNLDLSTVGTYHLQTHAIDGAKNETDKTLNSITVLPSGVVSNATGPVNGARFTVYYFDAQFRQFRLWNAEQYGQENPQLTDLQGRYKLLLPSGTYYIHVSGQFGQSLKTNIFTIHKNTPINQNFTLQTQTGLSLMNFRLPFIEFGQSDVMMNVPEISENKESKNVLVDQQFPDFSLGGVKSTSLTGKPMIVTVLSQWLPPAASQMRIFSELAEKESSQVLVIMEQDSVARTAMFAKQGGYTVPIIADPDGTLLEPLHITNMPTHFFLDRKGIVTQVRHGILNTSEIEDALKGY